MNFHILGSFATALCICGTALSDTLNKRLMYAAFSIIAFYATLIIYGYEYDKMNMDAWKAKEKRLKKQLK